MTAPTDAGRIDFDSSVESATWVAARFGPVFPVDHPELRCCAGLHGPRTPCDGSRGKHPAAKWSIEATSDPARVREMFSGHLRNIGLACGPAGLLVVDEDEPGAFENYARSIGQVLPETFTVKTGRGRHIYFSQDGSFGNSDGHLRELKIDVRGKGGMVVAPGSLHASGARYLPDDPDAAVAELPGWLADRLRTGGQGKASRAAATSRGTSAGSTASTSERTIAGGWTPIMKDRHNAFVSYAGDLLNRGVPLHEALVLMRRRWEDAVQSAGDEYLLEQALADLRDVYDRYGPQGTHAAARLDAAVAAEANKLRARERAAEIVRLERAGSVQLTSLKCLSDFLAVEDEPARYRVDRLWPVGGRIVLAAQYKAGKSTLRDNLARALVDGTPFLDHFPVQPFEGTVVLIDDELDERMLRRWLRDQGIRSTKRVSVVPLRGRVASFDLLHEPTRREWARAIRDVNGTVVILDCLRPVLDALGLSEDKEAGRFLVAFDALLEESGASEGLVVHHMGHAGERSRGDTRLRDWPDAEWQLVRTDVGGDGAAPAARHFKAYGRDVDVAEGELSYDADTRRLTMVGGSRRQTAASRLVPEILAYLEDTPGASQRMLETALKNEPKMQVREAIRQGVDKGQIRTAPGPKRATLHYRRRPAFDVSAPSAPEVRQRTADECASAPLEGALSNAQSERLTNGALDWLPERMPSRQSVYAAA